MHVFPDLHTSGIVFHAYFLLFEHIPQKIVVKVLFQQKILNKVHQLGDNALYKALKAITL